MAGTVQFSKRYGLFRRARLAVLVFLSLFAFASVVGSYAVAVGNRGAFKVPPQQIGTKYQNVTFPSRDYSAVLSGWLFHADKPNGRSLIMVHGWHGNREDVDFVPMARAFLARGYDVLMFDMRGSGRSSGFTQTFGNREPQDILGAHDFMIHEGYAPQRMAIIGNSMGAASLIEAAPDLNDVAALICDSAYTGVTAAAETGLNDITKLPGVLALPALQFSQVWGINPALRPLNVVGALPQREFLFIQSRTDNLVDPASASQFLAASPNPGSQLLIINGRKHLDTFNHDPSLFMSRVSAFIDQQISQSSAWGRSVAR